MQVLDGWRDINLTGHHERLPRKNLSLGGKLNSGQLIRSSTAPDEFMMQPWSANLDYGFNFNSRRVSATTFQETVTHSISVDVSLKPTPHWDVKYTTSYDFKKG